YVPRILVGDRSNLEHIMVVGCIHHKEYRSCGIKFKRCGWEIVMTHIEINDNRVCFDDRAYVIWRRKMIFPYITLCNSILIPPRKKKLGSVIIKPKAFNAINV